MVVLFLGVLGLVRSEIFLLEIELGLTEFEDFDVELSFLSSIFLVGDEDVLVELELDLISLVWFLKERLGLRSLVWFLEDRLDLISLVWFLEEDKVGLISLVWFLEERELVGLIFLGWF